MKKMIKRCVTGLALAGDRMCMYLSRWHFIVATQYMALWQKMAW